MRPYQHNGPCPKCGLTQETDFAGHVTATIGTRYAPETNAVFDSKEPVRGGDLIALGTVPEHLERFCGRCHYTWAEACVDSGAPE